MPDDIARLPWTEEQWASIQRVVQEVAGKARVASSFLPLVGPLGPGQASVPAQALQTEKDDLRGAGTRRLAVDDAATMPFITLSCYVHLTTQQIEDPELASAKQMLGRAAGVLGRLEDAIVFNGYATGNPAAVNLPPIYEVKAQRDYPGLFSLDHSTKDTLKEIAPDAHDFHGVDLVNQVNEAIMTLEGEGHFGPFASVLGHKLFADANASFFGSLVTARERILPLLEGGPLLRSSVVDPDKGVVVSLSGSPIDLVVASDIHVKFLQVTLEPRYVLRLSERFVLRLKQPGARCLLVARKNGQTGEVAAAGR
jgi:uncharacterized linocin/CFP29 family protein